MSSNKICLNMIVKNESRIIERCIKSVYDVIDTWCIVDTGSTDGTQEIIKNLLKDKPGELIERPWVNFGHNRNEALRYAEKWGEWTLLTDADMVLVNNGFDKSTLNSEVCGYDIIQENHGTRYNNFRILNSSRKWQCIGVTHEYYGPAEGMKNRGLIDTLWFNDISDGGSKGDKFTRDIALLEQGLIDEPKNHRYMFYLAQSYRDTGNYDKAIYWYNQCAIHDSWDEERFYAKYMEGWCISSKPDATEDEISSTLLTAWMYRPWRIEPVFHLAMYYKSKQKWQQAYQLLKICAGIDYPKQDMLFITASIYEGASLDEFAVAAYWNGKYEESVIACRKLLESNTPHASSQAARIAKNCWFGEKALGMYSEENLLKYLDNIEKEINEYVLETA